MKAIRFFSSTALVLVSLGCEVTQVDVSKSHVEAVPDKLVIKDNKTGELLEFERCVRDSYPRAGGTPKICDTFIKEFRKIRSSQITITDYQREANSVYCCREIERNGHAYIQCKTFTALNDCPRTGDWYEG